MELKDIRGIGEKRAQTLARQGIRTPIDLLSRLPERYVQRRLTDLEEAEKGETVHLPGRVTSEPKVFFIRKSLSRLTFLADVGGQTFTVSVFNQHYLKKTLHPGIHIVLHGRISSEHKSFTAQKVFLRENFREGILPVYNVEGIRDTTFAKLAREAFTLLADSLSDRLPKPLRERYRLIDKKRLLDWAHAPPSPRALHQIRRRLKYEEFLDYQLKVRLLRKRHMEAQGLAKPFFEEEIRAFTKNLPFSLTASQKRALGEILSDIASDKAMRRMLQGDTGSGKTVVAMVSAFAAIDDDHQAAFLAPTEILARQHFKTAQALFAHTPYELALLTSTTPKEEREAIEKGLLEGSIHFVIGTHVLFSRNTAYRRLGFVVTDEQHRFGVLQRGALSRKGEKPDVLYLSATPIPRTLAMTLFGDMDITTIDEMPNSAKTVETTILSETDEARVHGFIEKTLQRGEQTYIISPTIEGGKNNRRSIADIERSIRHRHPKARVGLLHGRRPPEEKESVMEAFHEGMIDILVATTIVEVGMDVPRATLIVVHHAERLGLAQLHQLRGRVGRRDLPGRAVFLYEGDEEVRQRLAFLQGSADGFAISEYDMKRRGFGDFMGTYQSGRLRFVHADVEEDLPIMKIARDDAKAILADADKGRKSSYEDYVAAIEKELEEYADYSL